MSYETIEYNERNMAKRTAHELYGLCLGILSDGSVNQAEAAYLLEWLRDRPDVRGGSADPVVRDIYRQLVKILDDGVMDDLEALQLLRLLCAFTGSPQPQQVDDRDTPTIFLDDPVPVIQFPRRSFCFTGEFRYGVRTKCADLVERFGGVHSKNVTLKLDYLVVGGLVTPDWKTSGYGAKIIKAMDYRDDRCKPLAIVSEDYWIRSMRVTLKRIRDLQARKAATGSPE